MDQRNASCGGEVRAPMQNWECGVQNHQMMNAEYGVRNLRQRTKRFALEVIKMAEKMPRKTAVV